MNVKDPAQSNGPAVSDPRRGLPLAPALVVVAGLLFCGFLASVAPAGCTDSGSPSDEQILIGHCRDMVELTCEKTFECAPLAAPLAFGVAVAAGGDTSDMAELLAPLLAGCTG